MRSLANRRNAWIGTSMPAIATSPAAIIRRIHVNVPPSVPSAVPRSDWARPSVVWVDFHNPHAPIVPSSATLSSDLPSSIHPPAPKMRLSPEAGLMRLPLGASNDALKPSEPSSACPATAAPMVIANSAPSDGASFQPAWISGRKGEKSSTSARLN